MLGRCNLKYLTFRNVATMPMKLMILEAMLRESDSSVGVQSVEASGHTNIYGEFVLFLRKLPTPIHC